jgi:hypothetical protein
MPHDHLLMGLAVSGMSLACLVRYRWLLAHTHKGQRLVRKFGEPTARLVFALVCLGGIAFGTLLAMGVIQPLTWPR